MLIVSGETNQTSEKYTISMALYTADMKKKQQLSKMCVAAAV